MKNWIKLIFKKHFLIYGKPCIGTAKFGICKNISGIVIIDDYTSTI